MLYYKFDDNYDLLIRSKSGYLHPLQTVKEELYTQSEFYNLLDTLEIEREARFAIVRIYNINKNATYKVNGIRMCHLIKDDSQSIAFGTLHEFKKARLRYIAYQRYLREERESNATP